MPSEHTAFFPRPLLFIKDQTDALLIAEMAMTGQFPLSTTHLYSKLPVYSGAVYVLDEAVVKAKRRKESLDALDWSPSRSCGRFQLQRQVRHAGLERALRPSPHAAERPLFRAASVRPLTLLVPRGLARRSIAVATRGGRRCRVINYFYPHHVEAFYGDGGSREPWLVRPSELRTYPSHHSLVIYPVVEKNVLPQSPILISTPQPDSPPPLKLKQFDPTWRLIHTTHRVCKEHSRVHISDVIGTHTLSRLRALGVNLGPESRLSLEAVKSKYPLQEPVQDMTVNLMSSNGLGICEKDGWLFVAPLVLPNEQVEVNVASKDRIKPKCEYFRECSACSFQHWNYEKQLEHKRSLIVHSFRNLIPRRFDSPVSRVPTRVWRSNKADSSQPESQKEYAA
ncbi:hypothetical protein BDR26DRAFT_897321 [Obelidium mucronatum]|nr:hypothetical protein BDR26DRAFT_897321 [Obelidium mucronatum]